MASLKLMARPLDVDEDLALRQVGLGELDDRRADDLAGLGRAGRPGSAPDHCRGRARSARRRPARYVRPMATTAATGVGPPRLLRPTSRGPRCRSRSCARTASRSTGSSPGRPRRAGSCWCGAGGRRADVADHSPDGCEHPQPGPRVRRRGDVPRARAHGAAPSPTSTRPTSGCGSATAPAPGSSAPVPRPADRRAPPGRAAPPRRARRHGGRRLGARRARGPPRRAHRGRCTRVVALAVDREAGAGRVGPPRGSRLLRRAAWRTGRATRWPSWPGTTRTCPGTPRRS